MNLLKTKNNIQNIRMIDVKKRMYTTAIALVLTSISVIAQTAPPNPPATPQVSLTRSNSSNSSNSITKNSNSSHNSSVSVSHSNDSYRFKARYHKSKNPGIKDLLISELGRKNLKINGNTLTWSETENGENNFECKLSKGRLYMYLNTENISKSHLEKIKNLGEDLKYYISGSSKSEDKTKRINDAKRKLEEAKQELEAAQRNR